MTVTDLQAVAFKQANCTYAENQDEYISLPAHRTNDGLVVTCWRLNWRQRVAVLFRGVIWHHQLTFGDPLQPIILHTGTPFDAEGKA